MDIACGRKKRPGAIFLSEKLAFFRIIPYIYMLAARFTAP